MAIKRYRAMRAEGYERKRKEGGKWLPHATRVAIYMRDKFTCSGCGADLTSYNWFDITCDHFIPRVAGGTDDPENLTTLCRRCNSRRGDRSAASFFGRNKARRIRRACRRPLNRELAKALIRTRTAAPEAQL